MTLPDSASSPRPRPPVEAVSYPVSTPDDGHATRMVAIGGELACPGSCGRATRAPRRATVTNCPTVPTHDGLATRARRWQRAPCARAHRRRQAAPPARLPAAERSPRRRSCDRGHLRRPPAPHVVGRAAHELAGSRVRLHWVMELADDFCQQFTKVTEIPRRMSGRRWRDPFAPGKMCSDSRHGQRRALLFPIFSVLRVALTESLTAPLRVP
jgi:hypothetical protein